MSAALEIVRVHFPTFFVIFCVLGAACGMMALGWLLSIAFGGK